MVLQLILVRCPTTRAIVSCSRKKCFHSAHHVKAFQWHKHPMYKTNKHPCELYRCDEICQKRGKGKIKKTCKHPCNTLSFNDLQKVNFHYSRLRETVKNFEFVISYLSNQRFQYALWNLIWKEGNVQIDMVVWYDKALKWLTFKCIFIIENYVFRSNFYWGLWPKVQSTMSQHLIMVWHRTGGMPLSE